MLMYQSFFLNKKKKSTGQINIIVQVTYLDLLKKKKYLDLLYVFDGEPVPRRSMRSKESCSTSILQTRSCIAIDLYLLSISCYLPFISFIVFVV
jgi:hypothetical protein